MFLSKAAVFALWNSIWYNKVTKWRLVHQNNLHRHHFDVKYRYNSQVQRDLVYLLFSEIPVGDPVE